MPVLCSQESTGRSAEAQVSGLLAPASLGRRITAGRFGGWLTTRDLLCCRTTVRGLVYLGDTLRWLLRRSFFTGLAPGFTVGQWLIHQMVPFLVRDRSHGTHSERRDREKKDARCATSSAFVRAWSAASEPGKPVAARFAHMHESAPLQNQQSGSDQERSNGWDLSCRETPGRFHAPGHRR